MNCAKTAEAIEMPFELRIRWVHMGMQIAHNSGNFKGENGRPVEKYKRHCRELCKNGGTDPDGIYFVDSGGPKEVCRPIRYIGLQCVHEKTAP